MALQLALSENVASVGVAFPTAYIRIIDIKIDANNRVELVAAFYATAATRGANKEPVTVKRYVMSTYDSSAATSIKGIVYAYLKALPEFSGATDV